MDSILQTALADAVNSLASFFGTTTEAVMTHAPEFLTKYGWYYTLSSLPKMVLVSLAIPLVIYFMVFLVTLGDIELKHPILTFIGIFIFSLLLWAGTQILTCAVVPEIVGAHAVLELLKNMG